MHFSNPLACIAFMHKANCIQKLHSICSQYKFCGMLQDRYVWRRGANLSASAGIEKTCHFRARKRFKWRYSGIGAEFAGAFCGSSGLTVTQLARTAHRRLREQHGERPARLNRPVAVVGIAMGMHAPERSGQLPATINRCPQDSCSGVVQVTFAPIGMLRRRLPVAAKTALASAGANGGRPGSPTPPACVPGGASTMCTVTLCG